MNTLDLFELKKCFSQYFSSKSGHARESIHALQFMGMTDKVADDIMQILLDEYKRPAEYKT